MYATQEQIQIFQELFAGRNDVCGTHDPENGRAWQVKRPVTVAVIRDHLQGREPLGIYPLVGDRTRMVTVDFDIDDGELPLIFVRMAKKIGMPGYIERSKSKGFHVWIFLDEHGVSPWKPRAAICHILKTMGCQDTEVFPKHDKLTGAAKYGNFINLPLFGGYASRGRTVFVDEHLNPYADQWALLAQVERVSENVLDVATKEYRLRSPIPCPDRTVHRVSRDHALPPCAQRMLREGVRANQRVACFRLAVQLRKAGFPYENALIILNAWSERNRPADGKPIIRESEIRSQARWAYRDQYRARGCEDPAVMPFCDPACLISAEQKVDLSRSAGQDRKAAAREL